MKFAQYKKIVLTRLELIFDEEEFEKQLQFEADIIRRSRRRERDFKNT